MIISHIDLILGGRVLALRDVVREDPTKLTPGSAVPVPNPESQASVPPLAQWRQ